MAEKRKGKRRKEVNSSSFYVSVAPIYDFVGYKSYLHARGGMCVFFNSTVKLFS